MDRTIDTIEQRREHRRKLLKALPWAGGAIALLIVCYLWLGGKSVKASELREGEVTSGPLVTSVAASGTVVPGYEMIVNSPVASRILEVHAHAGDSVAAGTPLLSLDLEDTRKAYDNLRDSHNILVNRLREQRLQNRTTIEDLRTSISIKEMEVARLAIEVRNEERLDSLGSGTGDRVNQARTAFRTGELQLQGLRQKLVNETERLKAGEESSQLSLASSARDLEAMLRTLEQGQIPAPHSGIVTYLNTNIGVNVAAGEKLAVVGDLSHFKIKAEVPEASGFKINVGAPVTVRFGNREAKGSVANVEPQASGGMMSFTVALDDASDSRLRPGGRAQVFVEYGFKDKATLVPNGSYFKGPGTYQMFVYDGDSRLERRAVTLGDSNRELVEVVSGLKPGEKVVISDMENFVKNSSLRISK